jgi:large subunit ribosomal protein L23
MVKLGNQDIIKYPLISEDTVSLIEAENKLTFIVDIRAKKRDVIRAVESLYEVGVEKVNTVITPDGTKKAYVKLSPDFKAVDLAVKLGVF